MLDLQYIYDMCAENDIEIISDDAGIKDTVGVIAYLTAFTGLEEQAGYTHEVDKVTLQNISYERMEQVMLHELGHGKDPLGFFRGGCNLTEELGANRWAIANCRVDSLERVIKGLSKSILTYIDAGHTTAFHKSELLETAITLGIADAIAWRD